MTMTMIEAIRRSGEASGVVSASTGACPAVTFTVGAGTKVAVTKDTTVRKNTSCAAATKNGAKIEVKGTRASDGTITATRVEIDD